MREIKFRGKRVDNGEWVYGHYWVQRDLQNRRNDRHFVIVEDIEEYEKYPDHQWAVTTPEYLEVIPETVGQFTGLVDKNGKEIYEGDICNTQFGRGEIVCKSGCSRFVPFGKTAQIMDSDCLRNFDIKDDDLEVVGSIHDNPELLKEIK